MLVFMLLCLVEIDPEIAILEIKHAAHYHHDVALEAPAWLDMVCPYNLNQQTNWSQRDKWKEVTGRMTPLPRQTGGA